MDLSKLLLKDAHCNLHDASLSWKKYMTPTLPPTCYHPTTTLLFQIAPLFLFSLLLLGHNNLCNNLVVYLLLYMP